MRARTPRTTKAKVERTRDCWKLCGGILVRYGGILVAGGWFGVLNQGTDVPRSQGWCGGRGKRMWVAPAFRGGTSLITAL